MKRSPLAGIDLTIYPRALLLLVTNPSIILVPLLMAVIAVLMSRVLSPGSGMGLAGITAGIGGLIALLLELFGLGTACIIADSAWRHGRASFDDGWTEARRRGGDILTSAIFFSLILGVAQYAGALLGAILALILMAVAALFLIWAIPAAAVGGIPGGASVQVSIERVRATPIPAALVTIVSILVAFWLPQLVGTWLGDLIFPLVAGTPLVASLIGALIQAVALSYVALIITKTYTDAAFTRRW
jgi:hypothetical protein